MKQFKTWAGLMLLASALTASAQLGYPTLVVNSGSGEWPAAITNNTSVNATNAIIDCTQAKEICLQFKQELSDTGTAANTVTLQTSVDRSNWSSAPVGWTFSFAPNGTTATILTTNISVLGTPYVRIRNIANANANTGFLTNYTIRVWTKNEIK